MKKLILVLALCLVTFGFAGELGLFQVAPTIGIVMPEDDWDMGFQVGAVANIGSVLNGKIGLFPVINYWASKYDFDGATTMELKLSNIKLGCDAHYDLSQYFSGLYAGGGVALNIVKSEFPSMKFDGVSFSTTTESNSETRIGVSLLGGYNFEMAGKPLFVEGKFDLIDNLNTFGVKAGMFINMKKK